MTLDRILTSRRMEHEDLDRVLEIEKVSFPAPWSRQIFLQELSNRSSRILVFLEGERIVGYLCYWEVLDEAHLMNIAVHSDRRGRGYGKHMMDRLITICLKGGLKRIILDVGKRNRPARNLYRKCGFSSVGFRKNYYTSIKDDAIVMEKWLGSESGEDSPRELDDDENVCG